MGDQEQQHPKIVDAKDLPTAEVQALSEITFLSEMGYVNFQEQMDKIKNDPDAKKDISGYYTPDTMRSVVQKATDKAIEMGKITPQDQTRLMEKYEVVRSHTGSWDTIGLQVHLIKSMETQQTYAVLPGMGEGGEFIKDFIEAGAVSITGGSLRLGATKEFIETAAKDGLISREQGVVVVAHSLSLPVTLKLREEIPEWVQQAYLVHGPGQGGVVRELISQMGGKEYHYDPRITMIEIKEGSNFIHDFGRITAGTIVQVNHMNPKNFEILGFDTGITDTHGIREVRTALNHAHVSQLNEASEKIAQWEAYMKSLPAQSMSQSSERAVEITMEGLKAQQAQAAEAVKQRIQELESVIREVEHRIRRGEIREDRRETVREKIDGWRQEQKVLNQVVEKHGSVFVKQHPDGSPYHQAEIVQNVRGHQKAHDFVQTQSHGTDSYDFSPPVLPLIYKTVEGDSIDALAKALGVSRRDIEALNSHLELEGIEEVPGGILLNLPTNYRLNERPQTEEEKKVVEQLYVRAYHVLRTDSVERVAQIMEVPAAELVRTTPYLSDTLIVHQNTSHQTTSTPLYTVRRGDTISEIAKKTGISAKKIIEDNRIKNADKIIVGQTLIVSERTNVGQNQQNAPGLNQGLNQGSQNHFTHVIQKNETLSEIAQKHKTTVRELQEANRIKDPNKIIAGQALIVPEHSVTTQTQSMVASTHQQNTPGVNQGSQNHYIYVIQKNDTLSEVAQRHKTTVRELQAMNNIRDPNKIVTGEHLVVKRSSPSLPPDYYAKSKFDLRPEPNRQVVEPVVREVETHRVEIPWYERYTPPEPPAMSGWSSAEQEMRPDPPSNNSEELLPLWRQLRDPSLIRKLLVSNQGANEHACAKTWTWKPEEMDPITREVWSQTGGNVDVKMTVAMSVDAGADMGLGVDMWENVAPNMDEQLKKDQKDGLAQSRSYPHLHHTRCSDATKLVQHTPEFLGSVSSSPMALSQTSLSWMSKKDRLCQTHFYQTHF